MEDVIKVTKINDRVFLLNEADQATGYLIVGQNQAAVVDTMNGEGDLLKVVRGITDLPVFVINTHGHGDHFFGNIYFDKAYIHPLDLPLVEMFLAFDGADDFFKEKNRALPPFSSVKGGDTFDLGGATLEIIEIPGHTPGGILVLLKEDRLLFTGDSINRHLWMQLDGCLEMGEYAKVLESLLYLKNEADYILHGHAKRAEPVSLMDDLLKGVKELANGEGEDDDVYRWFGGEARQHVFAENSVICYNRK
ncbi:MAG: MBL fold metallo-hydrolase [Clostridia bacterium]|nr:MBL fold metallo-hydrolase [Clostridia bacterium]